MAMSDTSPHYDRSSPQARVARLSTLGAALSFVALLIACAAFCFFVFAVTTSHAGFQAEMLSDLEISAYVDSLTRTQYAVGAFFWLWVDILGIAMIWQVFRLFQDFRQGALMMPATGKRLRRVGVILCAMPLVNIVGLLLGGMILSAWVTQNTVHGGVSIDDSDIYALVVGLVLVAVGHIIAIAAEIDAENRAFI